MSLALGQLSRKATSSIWGMTVGARPRLILEHPTPKSSDAIATHNQSLLVDKADVSVKMHVFNLESIAGPGPMRVDIVDK
jgi:hypothetical protein